MNGSETYEELVDIVERLTAMNIKLREELEERDNSRAELRDMYIKLKTKFEEERAYKTEAPKDL